MTPSSSFDQLLDDVLAGRQQLTEAQLHDVLEHVARAGFDPTARERVRGRVAGVTWHGRVLRGSDKLPPAEVHYLWHVVVQRQWPAGTDQAAYVASIRAVITDPTSGVYVCRYQDAPSLGVVCESRELRGPDGRSWVLVQYRLGWGHWTTALQPELGLDELSTPRWSDLRWLRRPTIASAH
jgi:hypothetical protein